MSSSKAGGILLKTIQRKKLLTRAKNRQEAADVLGISKTTLWRKCKEFYLL